MHRTLGFILILTSLVSAQFLDSQQDPPRLNWKSIDTKHYEVIFPAEISADAQRVANLLERIYFPEIKTMSYPFKRLPVVLSTQSVIANGYVSIAPRMSEWYGTPFQLGSDDGDWYELLATHEMRHAAQYGKVMNRGLNKYFWGILGGEYAPAVISSLLIPRWFWEGDAVLIETALSKDGRGRKPDFDMGVRTLQLNGIHYSYYKAMLGSYADFVPDPYPMGYLVVSYARRYNPDLFWSNVLGRSAFLSFFPFGFSASMKGLSGKNAPTTYNDAMDEYRTLWEAQHDSLTFTPCSFPLSMEPATYTEYLFPQLGPDKQIFAIKSGLANAPAIIAVSPDGTEKKIVSASPLYTFSANATGICWAEYRSHWRWGKQSYSDIVFFDPASGRKRFLTKNKKYFSPALAPDGKSIAAVEFGPQRQSQLVILNRTDGSELERVPNPGNKVIKSPAWSPDSKQIVFSAQCADGKTLSTYSLEGKQCTNLLQNTWAGITQPIFWKNYVLFSSGYSGIDNIYAIDTTSRVMYQVSSRPFGAFNPSLVPGEAEMLFDDYSVTGQKIGLMSLMPDSWTNIDAVKDRSLYYYDPMVYQEQGGSIVGDENIPHIIYKEENYHPFRHLLNFHSWDIYPDSINMGVQVYSNDILNTTAIGAGLFYNKNEKSFGYTLSISYGKFYPIIDFSAQRLHRAVNYTISGDTETDVWTETGVGLGVRLPVTFSTHNVHHSLSLAAFGQIVKINGQDYNYLFTSDLNNGTFTPLSYSFTYAHINRYALKDVRRQWGQMIDLLYEHTPFDDGLNRGSHLFSRVRLYFPGMIKHHSLLLQANYERQNPRNYRFQPIIPYPRGYTYRYNNACITAGFEYALPLAYPDFALGAWWYLKRIKTNLFFDYGVNIEKENHTAFQSAGLELLLDHHWFSLPLEFEGGYRFSFRQEDQKAKHEIIIRLPLD